MKPDIPGHMQICRKYYSDPQVLSDILLCEIRRAGNRLFQVGASLAEALYVLAKEVPGMPEFEMLMVLKNELEAFRVGGCWGGKQ